MVSLPLMRQGVVRVSHESRVLLFSLDRLRVFLVACRAVSSMSRIPSGPGPLRAAPNSSALHGLSTSPAIFVRCRVAALFGPALPSFGALCSSAIL